MEETIEYIVELDSAATDSDGKPCTTFTARFASEQKARNAIRIFRRTEKNYPVELGFTIR